MDWNWRMDWSGVIWSWLGMLWWMIWFGSSRISYICNIPGIVISCILNVLDTTIRKQDMVLTMVSFAIRIFYFSKVNSAVFVCDSIFVVVRPWLIMKRGGMIAWS